MNIKKAISLAKGSDEKRVGFNLQMPSILKLEFEQFCKANEVKMTAMILALMRTALDEEKEKDDAIDKIEFKISQLEDQRVMLQKVYDTTGDEIKTEDGSIKYVKKDLDEINKQIKSLEQDISMIVYAN